MPSSSTFVPFAAESISGSTISAFALLAVLADAISRRVFWAPAFGPLPIRLLRATESPVPASILPLSDSAWTARHASSPPRAATCFLTICDALRRGAVVLGAALRSAAAASDGCEEPRHKRMPSTRKLLPVSARTARLEGPIEQNITMTIPPSLACARLIDDKALRPELPDDHVDAVALLDRPALVRERHPVGLAGLRGGGLAQLPDLLHLRHHERDAGAGVDQRRLVALVVERPGLVWGEHPVAEAHDPAGLGQLDAERIDAPEQLVVLGGAPREP